MKELFGLKDENGNEYKLGFDEKDLINTHARISYIKKIEPESEFKVGGWVVKNGSVLYIEKVPDKDKGEGLFMTTCEPGLGGHYMVSADQIRHATQEERESHLKKICDRKYNKLDLVFDEYLPDTDTMKYIDKYTGYSWVVYHRGAFVKEKNPQKKKLPKRIEEFVPFLIEAFKRKSEYPIEEEYQAKEFLKEYED